MENSASFRVWNVYPLDSLNFLAIVFGFLVFLAGLSFFYRRPERRLLMAIALILAPLYTMLIWNLAVNLIPKTDWEIFGAYLIYIFTAQGIISLGRRFKESTLRWGGWFFLLFTFVHYLFINLWLLTPSFQYSLLLLFATVIYLNRDHLPW